MTTATSNMLSSRNDQQIAAPTLMSLVSIIFGLELREKLNAEAVSDQSDASMVWGL